MKCVKLNSDRLYFMLCFAAVTLSCSEWGKNVVLEHNYPLSISASDISIHMASVLLDTLNATSECVERVETQNYSLRDVNYSN